MEEGDRLGLGWGQKMEDRGMGWGEKGQAQGMGTGVGGGGR